jgi:hypothetical protein
MICSQKLSPTSSKALDAKKEILLVGSVSHQILPKKETIHFTARIGTP